MAVNVIGLFLAVVAGFSDGARLPRWANNGASSSSSSGSFAGASAGGMGAYAGTGFPNNNGFAFPVYQPQPFFSPQDLWLQYQQQFQNAFPNTVNNGFGGDAGLGTRILGNPNGISTSASASIGPNGGFGTINGVGFRLGEYEDGQGYGDYANGNDFMTRGGPGVGASFSASSPGPNGGNFGTFSSSSSSQQTVDGKTTSQQQSTYGVNDNGKIHFRTFKNP